MKNLLFRFTFAFVILAAGNLAQAQWTQWTKISDVVKQDKVRYFQILERPTDGSDDEMELLRAYLTRIVVCKIQSPAAAKFCKDADRLELGETAAGMHAKDFGFRKSAYQLFHDLLLACITDSQFSMSKVGVDSAQALLVDLGITESQQTSFESFADQILSVLDRHKEWLSEVATEPSLMPYTDFLAALREWLTAKAEFKNHRIHYQRVYSMDDISCALPRAQRLICWKNLGDSYKYLEVPDIYDSIWNNNDLIKEIDFSINKDMACARWVKTSSMSQAACFSLQEKSPAKNSCRFDEETHGPPDLLSEFTEGGQQFFESGACGLGFDQLVLDKDNRIIKSYKYSVAYEKTAQLAALDVLRSPFVLHWGTQHLVSLQSALCKIDENHNLRCYEKNEKGLNLQGFPMTNLINLGVAGNKLCVQLNASGKWTCREYGKNQNFEMAGGDFVDGEIPLTRFAGEYVSLSSPDLNAENSRLMAIPFGSNAYTVATLAANHGNVFYGMGHDDDGKKAQLVTNFDPRNARDRLSLPQIFPQWMYQSRSNQSGFVLLGSNHTLCLLQLNIIQCTVVDKDPYLTVTAPLPDAMTAVNDGRSYDPRDIASNGLRYFARAGQFCSIGDGRVSCLVVEELDQKLKIKPGLSYGFLYQSDEVAWVPSDSNHICFMTRKKLICSDTINPPEEIDVSSAQ